MEIKVQVTNLSHEDLVNLLSTALFGSPVFAARLLDDWKSLETKGEEKTCFEDRLANVLRYGGEIAIIDVEADGEKHPIKGVSSVLLDGGEVEYHIDLEAVKNGLKNAFESKDSCARYAAVAFLADDGGFDAIQADALLQVILFNEVIYG